MTSRNTLCTFAMAANKWWAWQTGLHTRFAYGQCANTSRGRKNDESTRAYTIAAKFSNVCYHMGVSQRVDDGRILRTLLSKNVVSPLLFPLFKGVMVCWEFMDIPISLSLSLSFSALDALETIKCVFSARHCFLFLHFWFIILRHIWRCRKSLYQERDVTSTAVFL